MSKSAGVIVPRRSLAAPIATELRSDDNVKSVLDSEGTRIAKAESWIARNIIATLERAYPNRDWRVTVDVMNKVAMVQAPLLDSEKGYFMHMHDKTLHQLCRQAKKAAGEVLERFEVSRDKKWDPERIEDLERNSRGNAIGPDSAATSITGDGTTLKEGER